MNTQEVTALKEYLESQRQHLRADELADLDRYIGECQRVIDGTATPDDIEGVQFMLMQKFDREMEKSIKGDTMNQNDEPTNELNQEEYESELTGYNGVVAYVKVHKTTSSEHKYVEFHELQAGDCRLDQGLLRFHPGGNFTFWARVWSTDSNDSWHYILDLRDKDGKVFARIPEFNNDSELLIYKPNTKYERRVPGKHAAMQAGYVHWHSCVMHYKC
jgi:hypothetical protein